MSKVERRPKRNPTSVYLTRIEISWLKTMCAIEGRTQGEMMRELIRNKAKEMGFGGAELIDGKIVP